METKNQDLKRALIYIIITFALTWAYCLLIVYPIANGEALTGVPALATQLTVAAAMFCPAIGVLLTRLVTKEGFQNVWLRPHIKGNIKHYLLAWFGPAVLTFAGMAVYFLMIIGFSYFYSTIQFNPVEISNNLKKNGGFIPGFRPGKPTSEFIQKVINKIVVFGSVYLGIVALLPIVAGNLMPGVKNMAIGGTSIIIVVGVALETVKALEAQMLMRHYKGFLD